MPTGSREPSSPDPVAPTRDTRDGLFLNFALAFFVAGGGRVAEIFFAHPSQASPWMDAGPAFLFMVAAIAGGNRRTPLKPEAAVAAASRPRARPRTTSLN